MSWVRLDDGFAEHPKLLDVGALAGWLWVCGLAYCNRQKARDGFIPEAKMPHLYPVPGASKLAQKLIDARLWEKVKGGYMVHDYHDYQPTKDHSEVVSQARAEAGRRGGNRSGETRRSKREANCFDASEANGQQKSEAKLNPVPSRPDPIPDPPLVPPGGGERGRAKRLLSAVPESSASPDEVAAWCANWTIPNPQENQEVTRMLDYFRGTGGRKADWLATWRNWQRRAPEFAPRNGLRSVSAHPVQEVPATGRLWKLPEGLGHG